MISIVYCECGESDLKEGFCAKCNKDRRDPECDVCKERHQNDEHFKSGCNTETVAKLIDQSYWIGAMHAGMDNSVFEAALIKGENGDLD